MITTGYERGHRNPSLQPVICMSGNDDTMNGKRSCSDLSGMTMVLHGPEIFDSGKAAWLAEVLCPARLLVAGVMARTAAEESDLSCEFPGVPPSVVMLTLEEPCFLANEGKTPESGRIFGEIIASRLGEVGLLHIECASSEIICWNRKADSVAREISRKTGYLVVERSVDPQHFREGFRTIRGCIPGEPVFVNGTIIGRATATEVCLRTEGERLIPVSGLEVKDHGLEKLQRARHLNISRAWCKSGTIRSKCPSHSAPRRDSGRVLFVDHCGHELFRLIQTDDICGIVSVGDDTTSVCGHIGAQRGVPVLGIVDGDCDGIVPPRYAPGSVIAAARGISDDELGSEIASIIPDGIVSWDECVRQIIGIIGNRATFSTPG